MRSCAAGAPGGDARCTLAGEGRRMPEAGGCAAEASARAGPPAVDPGARGVPPEPPKDGGDPGGEIVIPPALDDGD